MFHRPFLMIGVSFLSTFILFLGLGFFPEIFPLFVGIFVALILINVILLWRDLQKARKTLRSGLPRIYGGYSSSSQNDEDDKKKGDGIDNPSDRRDVSDD